MSTTILSFQNRVVIETLHSEGRSLRYIANYLGFSKTTIFNELHRLNSEYQAELAQTDFEQKVSQRGRKSSLTKNLKHLVEEKIQVQKWSPEQVAHVVGIAYKTVYNWIDQGWLDVQLPDLPDHGIRRHRAKEKRGTFSHGRSIEERPHKVETRQEFGHFEADTVLSGKRKGQAVATFVERKSRLTIVKRLHGRDSQSMTQAVLELASQLQDKLKTLTVDHGKEFANYQTIERQTGTPVYFAHAYSPHERGSNENRNRILRRFIPKGQAIEELSDRQLVQINWYLNSRPLKCLNWHTPIEIFLLNRIEQEAQHFASALLMPEKGLALDMAQTNMNFLKGLKLHWLVSLQALIYRGHEIGIITDRQALFLRQTISRNGWRKEEPYDHTIGIEYPSYIKSAIKFLVKDKERFLAELSEESGIYQDELSKYFYLSENSNKNNINLKIVR